MERTILIETFDTELERVLDKQLKASEKQFAKCEKTFLIMAIAIVALVVKIIAT